MTTNWWGTYDFKEGETRCWRLGPFSMWVNRLAAEVRVTTQIDPAGDPVTILDGNRECDPASADAETVRYGVRDRVHKLEIAPTTADRAVIVKSEDTFIVPPGGTVTAFVGSPIWVRVQLASPLRPLHEVPTQRPSDTWFGPSTLEGEICYAVRTSVRYNLENVPVRPDRVVSVVHVINRADSPLPLARLRLPLPHLSLYASGDGRLWTESVTLDRQQHGDLAEIKLGKSAPREAGECVHVSGPREKLDKRTLIRSFTGLLGPDRRKEWL